MRPRNVRHRSDLTSRVSAYSLRVAHRFGCIPGRRELVSGRSAHPVSAELEGIFDEWRGGERVKRFTMELDTLFRLDRDEAVFVIRRDEHGMPVGFLHFAVAQPAHALSLSSMPRRSKTPNGFNVPLVAATLAGLPADEHIAPGNIFQNSNIAYKFPNIRTVCHRLETTPFRPSWIRTPGRMQNTFANECFFDELAAAAAADPIAFRRKYLDPDDKRGLEVLDRVATLAKWDRRPSPKSAAADDVVTGRGVAYCKYELLRTYIAAVAEVEVKRSTGEIRCTRFYLAHDCGQIINPDGLKNQIEGNVIQTVSRTLKEELKFSRSAVTSVDWASYPILTFPEIPEIVIDLIDRPAMPPWGAGEPSAAVVPSAISNAVFDAIGVRLRSVPFTPDKVKAAMKGAA